MFWCQYEYCPFPILQQVKSDKTDLLPEKNTEKFDLQRKL